MNKKIIAVIVNWNRKEAVRNLLLSLRNLNCSLEKIIVVDNASTDGSSEMLKREFNEVLLVENQENLGGTGGFNTGMKKALEFQSDYIWLLDNDVEVEENSLKGLADVASMDEKIAITGSTICYLDYRDYIFEIGGWFDSSKGLLKPNKRNCFYDKSNLNDFYDVDYCASCSLLVKTDLISRVGLMDEHFFLTGDDLEWTYRFKRKGYRVLATPLSRIYHQTKVVLSANYMYYNCRNSFYLYSRLFADKHSAMFSIFSNFFIYSLLLYEAKNFSFNDLIYIYEHSLTDTMNNKMGKCDLKNISFAKKDIVYKKEILMELPGTSVINSVDVEDEVVRDIFEFLKEKPCLLVRSDKKRLEGLEKSFFTYDYKNPINLMKLLFSRKFDWAICFEEQRGTTLAALLAKKVILLTKDGNIKTKNMSKLECVIMVFRALLKAITLYMRYSFI